jgi:hypothetical protein
MLNQNETSDLCSVVSHPSGCVAIADLLTKIDGRNEATLKVTGVCGMVWKKLLVEVFLCEILQFSEENGSLRYEIEPTNTPCIPVVAPQFAEHWLAMSQIHNCESRPQ